MADGNINQDVQEAIDSAQAAAVLPLAGIVSLLVEKGVFTRDELEHALRNTQRPNVSIKAEAVFQQIIDILTAKPAG